MVTPDETTPIRPAVVNISQDGQTWVGISLEDLQRLLGDRDAICWIDLSSNGVICHVSLDVFRNMLAETTEGVQAERPRLLFGIPVVYEDDVPALKPGDIAVQKPAPLTYEQRSVYACKVCGNVPDEEGSLEHGRGCYMLSVDGGGSEFVDFSER